MNQEIFRFTVIRPPQRQTTRNRALRVIAAYPTELSALAKEFTQESSAKVRSKAKKFVQSEKYVSDLSILDIPLSAFDKALLPPAKLDSSRVREQIKTIFGCEASLFALSQPFKNARERLADSLLAVSFAGLRYAKGQERLVRGLQLCAVIETLSDASADTYVLTAVLSGLVVQPRLHKKTPDLAPARVSMNNDKFEQQLSEARNIRESVRELQRLYRHKLLRVAALGPMDENAMSYHGPSDRLSKKEVEALSPTTRELFRSFKLPDDQLFLPSLINLLVSYSNVELTEGLYHPGTIIHRPTAPGVPISTGRVRIAGLGDLMMVRQRIRRYELGEVAYIENALRGESFARTFRRKDETEILELSEFEKSESTERDLQSTSQSELKNEAEKTIREDLKFEAGVTVNYDGPMIEVGANAGFEYERSTQEVVKTSTTFAREVVDRSVNRIQERVLQRRSSRASTQVEETTEHRINNIEASDHMVGIYRWVEKVYEAQIINYGQRLMLEFMIPEPAAFYRMVRADQRVPGVQAVLPPKPEIDDVLTGARRPLTAVDIDEVNYLDWVSRYEVMGVLSPPQETLFIGTALDQGAKDGAESISKVLEQNSLKVEEGYIAKEIYLDWAGEADTSDGLYWEVIVGTQEFKSSTPMNQHCAPYDGTIPVSMVVKNYGAFTVNILVKCEPTEAKRDEWRLSTFNSIMARYASLKAEYDDQVAAAEIQSGVGMGATNSDMNRMIERNELKRLSIAAMSGQNFELFDAMSESGAPLHYPEVTNFAEAQAEGDYIQFLEQAIEWRYMTYVFYPYFWGRKQGWIGTLNQTNADPLFEHFLQAGAARVQVPVRAGFVESIEFFLRQGKPWFGANPPSFEDTPEDGHPPFLPIIQELREQTGADFVDGPGRLSVVSGSTAVNGLATFFEELRDQDREIRISGKTYRIRSVASPTSIELEKPYVGDSSDELIYALGPKLVGQPWEVRLPTTLVMLQPNPSLPTYPADL
jgi:hypothetical protein